MTGPETLSVDLDGTVSVVVGASQGIGAAIAVALAKAGSEVVVAARDRARLAETRARAEEVGARTVDVRTVDVTSVDSIRELADGVVAAHGVPGILVNSAGGALHRDALDVTPQQWDQVLDTHLRGTFFACQAFARGMAERGYGKIINLSSTWASTTAAKRTVYCAAKAGVGHLTAALATEWGPLGIRVNAIAPTMTLTPRVIEQLAEEPQDEAFLSKIPLGRRATTEDLTGAALFLASSASDFVTGHTLYVDGGWRASK